MLHFPPEADMHSASWTFIAKNLNIIFFAYCQTKPKKVHTECILFVR